MEDSNDKKDEKTLALLLEQYKIYNDSINRLYSSWSQTDSVYLAIISGLFAAISILIHLGNSLEGLENILRLLGPLILLLSISWYLNIASYMKIRKRKFTILQKLESGLPSKCFTEEFDLAERYASRPYMPHLENIVPIFMSLLGITIIVYSFVQ